MKHFFLTCLVAELITIVLVGLIFSFISNPFIAGMVAGSLFISVGLLVCSRGIRSSEYRHTYSFKLGCVHLLLALTMVLTRIAYPEATFASARFLGIPGPVYHE